jgi:8-oxo-dGTP diphosphatase
MRRAALGAFRYLPRPVRRLLVHLVGPSYSVGAVAVMRRGDGQVLLVEQRHTGGWALPGGLLQRREGAAAAVAREVREEVGLLLEENRLPVPVAAVDPFARRVDLVFVVDVASDVSPRVGDDAEVRRMGWFPLEADGLPAVTDPTMFILRSIRLL